VLFYKRKDVPWPPYDRTLDKLGLDQLGDEEDDSDEDDEQKLTQTTAASTTMITQSTSMALVVFDMNSNTTLTSDTTTIPAVPTSTSDTIIPADSTISTSDTTPADPTISTSNTITNPTSNSTTNPTNDTTNLTSDTTTIVVPITCASDTTIHSTPASVPTTAADVHPSTGCVTVSSSVLDTHMAPSPEPSALASNTTAHVHMHPSATTDMGSTDV